MLLTLTITTALLAAPGPAATDAAPPRDAAVVALEEQRAQTLHNHLARVLGWSAANLVGGTALIVLSSTEEQPALLGIGAQSTAWGAINLLIVGVGSISDTAPTGDARQAHAAENALGDVLWLNVGLDAGYIMAGGTLALASLGLSRNASTPLGRMDLATTAVSHGLGIVLQGAGLMALDLIALHGSDARAARLAERMGGAAAAE